MLNVRNELRTKKQLSIQHIIQHMEYVKCEKRFEAKETAEHPAQIQQMEYVKCDEQVEAKETAEHPAHNVTCEERIGI